MIEGMIIDQNTSSHIDKSRFVIISMHVSKNIPYL